MNENEIDKKFLKMEKLYSSLLINFIKNMVILKEVNRPDFLSLFKSLEEINIKKNSKLSVLN